MGYLLLQCANLGQVLARGDTLRINGQTLNCVRAQTQQVMSAVPIVVDDGENLEIKAIGDKSYTTIFDPAVKATSWQPLALPAVSSPTSATAPSTGSIMSKFENLASDHSDVLTDADGAATTNSGKPTGAAASIDTVQEEKAPATSNSATGKQEVAVDSAKTKTTSGAAQVVYFAVTAGSVVLATALLL